MKEKAYNFIKKNRTLALVLLLGLILMTVPTSCEKSEDDVAIETLDFSLEEFQKKLESILQAGEGVGRAKVMLTQKTTSSYVYAEETRYTEREQQNGELADYNYDQDRKPSIITAGSGKQVPITIKQVFPEFMGAVVVCDGADNVHVQTFVAETVCALTGITYDHIAIIKMKQ